MVEAVSQRFQGSCMMLLRREGEEVSFLGSGFLVHPDGYLLTAGRNVPEQDHLFVVAPEVGDGFTPVTQEEVSPVPVQVVSRNSAKDVALLKLKPELEINMPAQVLGSPVADPRGATLMNLGVPFGYYRIHSVTAVQSVLSGRLQSRTGTNLIIFDRRVQYGDVGGPLVSVSEQKVIGIVGGVFDPLEMEGRNTPEGGAAINSDLSYAVSIEYGATLLESALSADVPGE